MGRRLPAEALKAQTVAARGYAIKRLQANTGVHYDITDTTSDQVYRGYVANETSEEAVLQAVEQTRGKVLTYGGSIITAYYGATNGWADRIGRQCMVQQSAVSETEGRFVRFAV